MRCGVPRRTRSGAQAWVWGPDTAVGARAGVWSQGIAGALRQCTRRSGTGPGCRCQASRAWSDGEVAGDMPATPRVHARALSAIALTDDLSATTEANGCIRPAEIVAQCRLAREPYASPAPLPHSTRSLAHLTGS